ncbi:hypothetical protein Tco_0617475 [Tanacetum coccineum]
MTRHRTLWSLMSAGHKEVQKGCLDSLFRDKEKRGGVVIRIEDSRSAVVDAVVDGYDATTLSPHKFVGGPGSSGILLMNEALYELKYSYIENMRIWNVKGRRTWYIDAVKELLSYSTKEGIYLKNKSGFNPLHITASEGHLGILAAAIGAVREVDYIA